MRGFHVLVNLQHLLGTGPTIRLYLPQSSPEEVCTRIFLGRNVPWSSKVMRPRQRSTRRRVQKSFCRWFCDAGSRVRSGQKVLASSVWWFASARPLRHPFWGGAEAPELCHPREVGRGHLNSTAAGILLPALPINAIAFPVCPFSGYHSSCPLIRDTFHRLHARDVAGMLWHSPCTTWQQ